MTFERKIYGIARGLGASQTTAKLVATVASLESAGGSSILSRVHKNHFGIKGSGTAGSATLMTTEVENGVYLKLPQKFAKNKNDIDSVKQFLKLLSNPRYKSVKAAKDLDTKFTNLQASGYATDPNYATVLKKVYNRISTDLAIGASVATIAALMAIAYFNNKA